MKIYKTLDTFTPPRYAVVTSGTFDGVHLGHQKILERIRQLADWHSGETVLITYWPHPRLVLYPEDTSLKLLSSFQEKAALLEKAGIDHLISIPFDEKFASQSSEEFIREVLVKTIGTKKLVIGYDHRFGKNREGSFEHLAANAPTYGFEVEEISRQDIDEVGISSTKIRNALNQGDIALANSFLGYPYMLNGTVVSGDKIGRTLGYPTANVEISFKNKLIPADGIYAVKIIVDKQEYKGMLYIGNRPTLEDNRKKIEVNLFDFSGSLYEKEIQLHIIEWIRADQKFDSLEQLKERLHEDEKIAKQILFH